jgi:hypothetical protein
MAWIIYKIDATWSSSHSGPGGDRTTKTSRKTGMAIVATLRLVLGRCHYSDNLFSRLHRPQHHCDRVRREQRRYRRSGLSANVIAPALEGRWSDRLRDPLVVLGEIFGMAVTVGAAFGPRCGVDEPWTRDRYDPPEGALIGRLPCAVSPALNTMTKSPGRG